MNYGKLNMGDVYFVNIDKGEDLLGTMQDFVNKVGIRQGVILCGLGVQDGCNIYEVIDYNYPEGKHYEKIEGPVEVCVIQGNVVEGEVHMHSVLSTENGVWGGHVEPGNKTLIPLQMIIASLGGARIVRRPHTGPGLGPSTIDFE